MKYAVVEISGKQFIVSNGDILDIEKIDIDKKKLIFDKLLLVNDGKKVSIGNPYLKNAKVEAEIVKQFKDKKIRVAKFRAKSRYRLVKGHRQPKTKIKIVSINL